MKACAEYGREDVESISREVEGKTADEVYALTCQPLPAVPLQHLPSQVKRYWEVFWERNEELQDLERIMNIIDKGEQKIQRKKDIKRALDAKVGGRERERA